MYVLKVYMKKNKLLILTAIIIGLAASILTIKAFISHSTPATGVTFLSVGFVFLVIIIARN